MRFLFCIRNEFLQAVLLLLISSYGAAQGTFSEYFDISGPTTVCADGVTVYTYSGPSDVLNWSITGGTIISAMPFNTISVRWTSTSGTLYATGSEQLNCWYNDGSPPYGWVCDTYYYYSNPFSVSGFVAGTVTASANRCAPASAPPALTLTGHTTGSSIIRWERNSGSGWTSISGTAGLTSYNYASVSVTTQFRAVVSSANCTSTSATITIDPPTVAGTIAYGSTIYGSAAAASISISGHIGVVQRWESSTGGPWTAIPNRATLPITQNTQIRAVVKNLTCNEAVTNALTVYPVPSITSPSGSPGIAYGSGGSVQLATNVTYNAYKWYNGTTLVSQSPTITVNAAQIGTYTVEVRATATSAWMTSAPITVQGLAGSYERLHNAVSTTMILEEGRDLNTNLFTLLPSNIRQSITYTDGLGRPIQTVGIGQAPGGGDVVAHNSASRFGVADTAFLPYSITLRDGHYRSNAIRGSTAHTSYVTSEQYLFYQGTAKVAQSQHPFARTLYSKDPTLRAYEQGAPGADWQPVSLGTKRTVRSSLDLITPTSYRVRYWKHDGTTNSDYPANSVVVAITTDENGNRVRTFTNALGQTVLKQVQLDTLQEGVHVNWLETYYVYDEFGRLKYILPPKALTVLGTGTTLDANSANVAELIHRFVYDNRGRVMEKKVPGSAWQFIVYDKHDRVVLTQDGNLKTTNRWTFVKYDIYNRVVYTGLYTNTAQTTRAAVQGLLDAQNYNTTPWFETEGTSVHGYTNLAWPTTGTIANTILAVNYYDHYNFDRTGGDDFTYDNAHFSGQPATRSTSTRGMATGSKRNVLDANGNATAYWITGAVFYDHYDRPVQTQTNNHLHTAFTAATLDKSTIVYDFMKALRTKTSHYQNATTAVHLEDRNEFDHAGRVLKTFRRINGGAEQQLVEYEYNALGQLVDKKLHNTGGSAFLQSVDYRYNIRGWLTSINNAQLIVDQLNDETTDYFGLELSYNTVVSGLSNTPHYNGNISAVRYKAAHAGAASLESTNGTRSFKYTYDKSDRLTAATFAAQDNSGGWTKQLNTLNETMTYDANGNILTLARNQNNRGITTSGGLQLTSTAQTIDQLTYTYASAGTGSQNSNLMIKVEDAISGTVGQTGFVNGLNTATEYEYTYTEDGSLTADQNKGISSIVYNFLGKPQTINYTSGRRVEYTYDAAGTKLRVRSYQAATLLTTTNYSGGFVYEGASPALSFFSSPEGRVVRNGANFEYQYAIADHQGNTRMIFSSVTPPTMNVTATFEGTSGDQSAQFTNVNPSRVYQHNSANNTAGGSHVIGLNGSYKVGPGKSIKVYPGETVSASVFAYYEASSGYGSNQGTVNQWIAAVAGAFGGVSGGGGESGSIFNGVNNAIGAYGMGGSQQTNRPAAYLNYIIFDQQYKLINMGWQRVSGTPSIKHQLALAPGQIKEPGYAYFYLSYENEGSNFVYFDDFQVTHTRNNIIQYNEYYAFQQTTANSWTRENVTGNNFLGNGGTEVNTTTQLYDLDFRNYDPLLGRMNGVDPMATKYASLTPYNYSFNDPVTFTDVNGADPDNGCTLCEPIFQPYTGFQYSNSYGGFVQDDVIYYRQSGWTGPVHRYRGSALYMDQNVAPGGSGAWTTQLMMSFADEARRSGNINWFAGMFGMRFGGGINGLTDGLASLGLSLVPNKPPEPPIRPAIDPKELVASKTGLYHVPDERPAPVDLFDPNVNKIEGILNHLYYIGHNRGKQHHLRDIIKSFKEPVPWWKSVLGRIGLYGPNNSFNGRGKISGIDVEWGVQVAGTHTSEKWRTSKGNMNLTLLAQAVEGRSFVDGQSTTVYQIVLYRGNNNLVYLNFLNKDAWNKIYNYITGSP